jgi:glycerol kinase
MHFILQAFDNTIKEGEQVGNGYLVGVHQGMWETQSVILNKEGVVICTTSKAHKQFYPKPDWVEQDAVEIYENFKAVLNNIVFYSGISGEEFDVLAIANQIDTTVVWDRNTGEPIYRAIAFQCRRTINLCEELKDKGYENFIRNKTGLNLNPRYSASKIKWILDNVEGARERAEAGNLLAGSIDSWIIWKLTGGMVHATDYTNASRTLLFNINTLQWDEELLNLFEIPRSMLPDVKYSDCIFGFTDTKELFSKSIPIAGVIGDDQGTLFGQQCFDKGTARAVYSADTSILMNIGKKYIKPKNHIGITLAWALRESIDYAVEEVVEHTGDDLKQLIEELELLRDYSDIDPLVNNTKDLKVSVAIETLACKVKKAFDGIETNTGIKIDELWVEGNITSSRLFMQLQANMLNCEVARSKEKGLAALGAIYLAGLSIGVWKSQDELKKFR